ncbi:MAG: hypothetical protein KUG79_12525 [Pseudomonadales bacterium]|nr:hypothetical protein [Pseudomonadales bacterium]
MKFKRTAAIITAIILLSGCKANSLYYASQAHLGVDLSGNATAPTNFSVSGNTAELSIVPAKSDGSSHTLYGGLKANLKYLEFPAGNKIGQHFTTGEAAVCAIYIEHPKVLEHYKELCIKIDKVERPGAKAVVTKKRDLALVVANRSLIGLDVHFGEGESIGSNFGYKRLVLAAVPVTNSSHEVGSVYVDINVDSLTGKKDCEAKSEPEKILCSVEGGLKINQTIATGDAAKLMAIANRKGLKTAQNMANKLINEVEPHTP